MLGSCCCCTYSSSNFYFAAQDKSEDGMPNDVTNGTEPTTTGTEQPTGFSVVGLCFNNPELSVCTGSSLLSFQPEVVAMNNTASSVT